MIELNNLFHQFSGIEFTSLAFVVGIVVASLLHRYFGISAGGVISAALIVTGAFVSLYWAAVITFVSIIIYFIYVRFLNHIYYGRVPMFIMALMSSFLMLFIGLAMKKFSLFDDHNYLIGIIVPAIIAHSALKQGFTKTYSITFLAVAITLIIMASFYYIGRSLNYSFPEISTLPYQKESFYNSLELFLIPLSIILGFVFYMIKNVKAAGYIILPYLAILLIKSPLNFLLIVALGIVVFAITKVVSKYTLLVGLGRYSFVLILSCVLVLSSNYLLSKIGAPIYPFLGAIILASLTIAVIINDYFVYGVKKALPITAILLGIFGIIIFGVNSFVSALS